MSEADGMTGLERQAYYLGRIDGRNVMIQVSIICCIVCNLFWSCLTIYLLKSTAENNYRRGYSAAVKARQSQ